MRRPDTGVHRADRHQNEINCVVPVPISQSPRNQVMVSVPPSAIVIITQFAKMSLLPLLKVHPHKIPGYGFCASRTEWFSTPRQRRTVEERINTILTNNPTNKPIHDYRHGDLTRYEEQSEADPNSLIPLPNRIRSDDKNDCHHGQIEIQ